MKRCLFAVAVLTITPPMAIGATLFESGTLGITGLQQGSVDATNVTQSVFVGVRFELTQPATTTAVGGHFVSRSGGTFFGAIVMLDDGNDFPDSDNLSSPDVLGTVMIDFPNPSAEVFGDLSLSLNPGWYALVFGNGLFGSNGDGAATRNNSDIGDPSYIGREANLNWFNMDIFGSFFDNHRFVVTGDFVPEPNMLALLLAAVPFLVLCRAAYVRRKS